MYDVENIIRIGSAGAYTPALDIFDLVLADSAWSESSFAKAQAGVSQDGDIQTPCQILNDVIQKQRPQGLNIPLCIRHGFIPVMFFTMRTTWTDTGNYYRDHGCACVEMESFALFHNACILGKRAACLLTIC